MSSNSLMEFNFQSTVTNYIQGFVTLHVESCLFQKSTARFDDIKQAINNFLQTRDVFSLKIYEGTKIEIPLENEFLCKNVQSVIIYCEPKFVTANTNSNMITISLKSTQNVSVHIYVYQLNQDEGAEEVEGSDTMACQQWLLPSTQFAGLWDSLIFDDDIKINLLDYVATTMIFSDRKVDGNIVAWNRVVLLHGPPGTGKTSLCKALAQKLSIRLSNRYTGGQLIEINSHSLFSKWFSESGKLVMKMFAKIKEIVEDDTMFVCVLIDEVESLTSARKAALSGNEPSDAIRVVNALLTQIDQLKECKNVLVLTTSNITGAIDLAFVDRADIKQFIGLPSLAARYQILQSCVDELMRVAIIIPRQSLLDFKSVSLLKGASASNLTEATKTSLMLYDAASKCEGLSGRFLRKLPFLAHAFFIQTTCTSEQFLTALLLTIEKEHKSRSTMESSQRNNNNSQIH